MKILIVGLVKNIQFERLREEGEKRGHRVEGCYVSELIIYCSNEEFSPSLRGRPLDYDLIALWSLGQRRWEWYTAAGYLFETKNTIIVNSKVVDPTYKLYLSPSMNYYKQFREGISFPKSAVIFSKKSIPRVIDKFKFPLIVKLSQGRQGRGVYMAENVEALYKIAEDLEEKKEAFIIREYIPNDGDIRVFTVGYRAIGAMRRIPAKGEFRSNISLGGRGEKFDLEKYPEIRKIAETASKITGTEIAGVDIMINKETGKPYTLEVNPGPQFMGLEKYTGVNAAEEIIKYFEELYNKSHPTL